jgi:2,3-bisphosphoglycerate-independent phosphoglycerate mutase
MGQQGNAFVRFLFFFLDGIGLSADTSTSNPFVRAKLPRLGELLGGQALVAPSAPHHNERATLLALDANLGVGGLPQSATGQATLVTGVNVPQEIGRHYGPKPNPPITNIIRRDNLFARLEAQGYRAALLNAYPPRYFEAIESGRRLYSAIPLAVTSAGIPLKTTADLFAGRALSADFTGQGWREQLGFPETPVLSPRGAGQRLAELATNYDLSFYEIWLTDYAGHNQDMQQACRILETFDQVLAGLLDSWEDEDGLVFLTSDHGNMEDLSTRRHTLNPVPGLVIGTPHLRDAFTTTLTDISAVTPSILHLFSENS